MKNLPFAIVVAAPCLALLAGCGAQKAAAAADKDRLGNVRESVDLTIYSQDFAQVQEVRPVSLQKGRTKLRIGDVSKLLDPNSLLFDWSGSQGDAQVVSNVYDLGVSGGEGLLNRYLGHEVEMVWYGQDGKEGSREKGILEVAANGQTVLRTGDKLMVNPGGTFVAPARSEVVTMPQLTVDVESGSGRQANLSVAYLTRGLSWSADYVATIDPGSDAMKLECWATVTNHTGADYPNAKIRLAAGSPNRAAMPVVQEGYTRRWGEAGRAPAMKSGDAAPMPDSNGLSLPVAMGEMYTYDVPAAATISQEQMNRVKMLPSVKVPITKDYSIRLQPAGAWDYYGGYGGRSRRQSAQLAITFKNEKAAGLGMLLPAGALRVYEPDATGSNRYVGAASISDTPQDTPVFLSLSNVFDLTAEPKVLSTERTGKRSVLRTFEITLRNAKKGAVELRVVEPFSGTWHIEKESQESHKLNAAENEWKVKMPAGGEVKLTYTVRFGE